MIFSSSLNNDNKHSVFKAAFYNHVTERTPINCAIAKWKQRRFLKSILCPCPSSPNQLLVTSLNAGLLPPIKNKCHFCIPNMGPSLPISSFMTLRKMYTFVIQPGFQPLFRAEQNTSILYNDSFSCSRLKKGGKKAVYQLHNPSMQSTSTNFPTWT